METNERFSYRPGSQGLKDTSFLVIEFRFDFGLNLRMRKGFEFPQKQTSKIEDWGLKVANRRLKMKDDDDDDDDDDDNNNNNNNNSNDKKKRNNNNRDKKYILIDVAIASDKNS